MKVNQVVTNRAKLELYLALNRDKWSSNNWDQIYNTAFKAFKKISSHISSRNSNSRFEILDVLEMLVNSNALSPVYDNDNEWQPYINVEPGVTRYQSKRMPSLSKIVYDDGNVEFIDDNRVKILNGSERIQNSDIIKFVHNLYPLTLPYLPKPHGEFRVYIHKNIDKFVADKGSILIHLKFIITPDGELVNIDKYFVENRSMKNYELDKVLVEIDKEKYDSLSAVD